MTDQAIEEETDDYGNPINGDRIIYCCFPDCGCDGARLCQAENGPSERCYKANVEGMWLKNDLKSKRGIAELLKIVSEDEKKKKASNV